MSEQEIERGKKLLDDYYDKIAILEKMSVADKCLKLEKIAEDLVDYITDIIYNE